MNIMLKSESSELQSFETISPQNPLIVVNFKGFSQTTGASGLEIAKRIDQARKDFKLNIGVSVQPFFVSQVKQETGLLIFGQSLDNAQVGASTGSVLMEGLKEVGGVGSLVNHSEKRMDFGDIEEVLVRMYECGLASIVCVESVEEGQKVAGFEVAPTFVAVEPRELIGGDISVSTAKPELISESVEKIDSKILVGAGIKDGGDFKTALELGASGILVASGVCLVEDPYEVLKEFAEVIG